MKKITVILLSSFLIISYSYGQNTYFTSGGEMIFSFASINDNGYSESSTIRWAPFFNVQSMLNVDFSDNMGLFTGLAIRNVGYIYDNYSSELEGVVKKKFRSYNLGLPLGIKLGNLDKFFIYGGYEIEVPFVYKEKTFDGGDKIDKITGWFSKRQNLFQHGFLVGIQLPFGSNIKFKYYLSEFHNQDFTDSAGNKPYAGLDSNIFYISFSSYLFKNFDFTEPELKKIY